VLLEQRLDELDEAEQRPLFLGSMRRDQNEERQKLLQELDRALADYGKEIPALSNSSFNVP
jgi:hypothetical protein